MLAGAALAGFSVFAFLVARATRVETAAPETAMRQLDAARAAFGDTAPLLRWNASGRLVRRATSGEDGRHARRLVVLAYRAGARRVVRGEVPLWFLELKGPVLRLALRGTGVDLERLGLTPGELERQGPALLLDERRPDGDRIVLWSE